MDELEECYRVLCMDMRRMYHVCNLVHGDLSEYNILWHEERPVIIDVSQSVEHGVSLLYIVTCSIITCSLHLIASICQ